MGRRTSRGRIERPVRQPELGAGMRLPEPRLVGLMLRPTPLFRGMSHGRLLAAHRTRIVSAHCMSTVAPEVSLPSRPSPSVSNPQAAHSPLRVPLEPPQVHSKSSREAQCSRRAYAFFAAPQNRGRLLSFCRFSPLFLTRGLSRNGVRPTSAAQ
jgi:hypothetical protein